MGDAAAGRDAAYSCELLGVVAFLGEVESLRPIKVAVTMGAILLGR